MTEATEATTSTTPPPASAARLGAAIRAARGELSQTGFAHLVGRPQSLVSNWETGQRMPNLDMLARIEAALELRLGTLAVRSGYFHAPAVLQEKSEPLVRYRFMRRRDAFRAARAADELGLTVRISYPGDDGGASEDLGGLWHVEVNVPVAQFDR